MISSLEFPWVEFTLSVGTWDTIASAYVDTGFEVGLAIPIGVAREILADFDEMPIRTADGHVLSVPCWSGTVSLNDHTFRTEVIGLGEKYLLGRDITDQIEVCFEFGERLRVRFRGEE